MSWEEGEAPAGWTLCALGDVVKVVGGGTPKTSIPGNFSESEGHPWITPSDLTGYTDKYIAHGRRFLTDQGLATSSAKYSPAGSVLFSTRAPIGYVAVAANPVTTNQGFRSFVPNGMVDPEYIYYALKYLRPLAEQLASGTTFAELSGSNAAKLPIAYPSLDEQRGIVSTLDVATEKGREATAHLSAADRAIARFRSAVLVAACSGALTADFRDANAPEGEGQRRLEAILAERYRQWQLTARDRSSRIRYREPLPTRVTDLEIPQTWNVTSLSHLAHLDVGHAFRSAEYAESGVRLLRGENSSPGRLKWNDVRYWPSDRVDEFKHLLVREDDLILGMDRPIVSAGLKLARVTSEDVPSLLVQRVLRIRSVEPQASRFIELCLQQGRFERFLGHAGMTGSDLPHITGEGVARFPIPLPPVAEEAEIVRRVDRLLAFADSLVQRINAASQHLDRSSQAVLAKAFRGELVVTDGSGIPDEL